jgi:hypothetical protein
LRHEYIPRMQIAMLFSALLQLIQELKHCPQKTLNEGETVAERPGCP